MTRPVVANATVPVLMRITYTATGTPIDDPKLLAELGASPSEDPGWFWRKATPSSAARMAHHGHLAVGSLTTSYVPFTVGADLEPGLSTCADFNAGRPHSPHRLPKETLALVCQGITDPTRNSVLTYSEFCTCPVPLLDDTQRCLICGTRWTAQ